MIYVQLGILIISIAILVKSSDYFVQSASRIAGHLGVSEFVIGLTIVAIGTSLPELASSVMAAGAGDTEFVVGNIVGSNLANLSLVFGLAAILVVMKAKEKIFNRDLTLLMIASFEFVFFAMDGVITRFESFLLLISFVLYYAYIFELDKKLRKYFKFGKYVESAPFNVEEDGLTNKRTPKKEKKRIEKRMVIDGGIFVAALIAIIYSAEYLVSSASELAIGLGIPTNVVALTIVAIGTSLPELVVSIQSVKKGFHNIMIGNLIGSNIANMLLVGGVAGMIHPLVFNEISLSLTLPAMVVVTVMFYYFLRSDWKMSGIEGAFLLATYIAFLILIATSWL